MTLEDAAVQGQSTVEWLAELLDLPEQEVADLIEKDAELMAERRARIGLT